MTGIRRSGRAPGRIRWRRVVQSSAKLFVASLVLTMLVPIPACHRRARPLYGVIPKTRSAIFWQIVHAGAVAASRDLNVDIDWNGPTGETEFAQQITIVDQFINRHVDGIELAPNDREALVPAIERAKAAGVPVIIIDSGADTDQYVSFIATDNYRGGVMAAQRLGTILGKRGRVAMIGNAPGSASSLAREQGFRDTLAKEFPNTELVAFQFGMADYSRSLAVTEDILTAHPDLDGIFASNETSSVGALQGIQERGLAGKVKLVGFDSSPTLLEGLRTGVIDSLVLQDAFQMAYQGLKTLIDYRAGHTPPKRIDMPPALATHEQLNDPKIRQLLNPDIQKYLQ
jgi:ribose transport system substrate-binding protein